MPPARRVIPKRWRRSLKQLSSGDAMVASGEVARAEASISLPVGEVEVTMNRREDEDQGKSRSPDQARVRASDSGEGRLPSSAACVDDYAADAATAKGEINGERSAAADAAVNHDDATTDSEYSINEVVEGYILSGGQHPIFTQRYDDDELISPMYPIVRSSSLLLSSSTSNSRGEDESSSSASNPSFCSDDDVRELISPTPSAMMTVQQTVSKDYSDFDGYSMDGMSGSGYDLVRVNSSGVNSGGGAMHFNRLYSARSFDSVWGEEDDARSGRTTNSGTLDGSCNNRNKNGNIKNNSNNKNHRRNVSFDHLPSRLSQLESELKESKLALEDSERRRASAEDAFVAAERRCERYECRIRELERRNDELSADVRASIAHGESFSEEVRQLDSALREMDVRYASKSRELEGMAERHEALKRQNSGLEATVNLLVRDHLKMSERVVDAEEECDRLMEMNLESWTRGREQERAAAARSGALDEQNFRLERTVELLVEDHWSATERLVDAEDAREWFAAEVLRLDSALRSAAHSYETQSQELEGAVEREEALHEQNFKLEVTVDLLVEDHRRATETLVDAEDDRDSLESALREADRECREQCSELERAAGREGALREQNSRLEAAVDSLSKGYQNATEKLADSDDVCESLERKLRAVDHELQTKNRELERANSEKLTDMDEERELPREDVDRKPQREERESNIASEEQKKALVEQNSRLEATIELLVEDLRDATEKLVDAEDELEASIAEGKSLATELLNLDCALREMSSESRTKSQQLERAAEHSSALEEQRSRLEATVDLLVEDFRNATEKLVDEGNEKESIKLKFRELERAVAGRRSALDEQNAQSEAMVDSSAKDSQSSAKKHVDAQDEHKVNKSREVKRTRAEESQKALHEHESMSKKSVEGDQLTTEKLVGVEDIFRVLVKSQLEGAVVRRQNAALNEQISRLNDTVDLLVADHRNATEQLVDAEEERESLAKEVLRLRSDLEEACESRSERTSKSHAEDSGNATEKLVTAQGELAKTAFDVRGEHVSQLEEDKELLQKELARMNRERFRVMDRATNCDKLHKAAVEKLNETLNASTQQVEMLQKSMDEAAACHAAKISDLVTEIAQLSKEAENATSTVTDLTVRCDKLSVDLERSREKYAELESAKVKSEAFARNLALYSEALDTEKTALEVKLREKLQSQEELTQLHFVSEANVQRLSGEVVFAHEEISRLTMEKEALVEESASQIQQVNNRLKELEKENRSKSEEFQELWTKSNALLLEKESAMASVRQFQHDREQQSMRPSKEQVELSEKLEELQNENEQQRQQLEMVTEAGRFLRETLALLETEKEAALSSLSLEKEAIVEEKQAILEDLESQLQEANDRLNELEEENKLKSEEFQQMLTKSNASFLEKEAAIATVKQLQYEKELQSIGYSKEQTELSTKVEDLRNENKQQKQQINVLIEAEGSLRANLSAKVDELQSTNDKQTKKIEALIQTEGILREMNELLGTEKEATRQKLGLEINHLKRKNTAITDEMAVISNAYAIEKDRMQSEQDDLAWKIKALTQNMRLRLEEKDAIISGLNKQIQGHLNESMVLRNEIYERDTYKISIGSKLNAQLPNLEAMIVDQQAELEQKDITISDLRTEIETRYKSEILRMQSKVDRMELWLHESLSFATPPCSPETTPSNPQSSPPKRRFHPQESPFKGCSNPQGFPSPSTYPRRVLPKDVVHPRRSY